MIEHVIDTINEMRNCEEIYRNVKEVSFEIYKTEANYHSFDNYSIEQKEEIIDYFENFYNEEKAIKELWTEYVEYENVTSVEEFVNILADWELCMRTFRH